eukprot:2909145-Rhodomonas_salina.1
MQSEVLSGSTTPHARDRARTELPETLIPQDATTDGSLDDRKEKNLDDSHDHNFGIDVSHASQASDAASQSSSTAFKRSACRPKRSFAAALPDVLGTADPRASLRSLRSTSSSGHHDG